MAFETYKELKKAFLTDRPLLMQSMPLVSIGKTPEEHWNVRHFLPLPADTPFGNLYLKYNRIVMQLDRVNALALRVSASYDAFKNNESGNAFEHIFLSEEIVYWLRKSADDLIALLHVLHMRETTGIYPTRVEIDSIGGLLSQSAIPSYLESHRDFLNVLNEISNASKHSFINSDITLFGRDEPCFFALALKRNNLVNQPGFYSVSVRDILARYNEFFVSSRAQLQRCPIHHHSDKT